MRWQARRALAERLEYTMADLGYRFPQYPVPDGGTEIAFLRQITEVGARERYRPYHDKARAQIARELDLIEKLDLAGYFLIVWDIVNYARQQDILVQGRGSAANSAVCYSLGITAVDPIAMDLLFERFLSEERGEWPDIDLDLPSGDRRERVIQHVYEKYGRLGAAMTANVITYRSRSAAREVGKALSLDEQDIDRLARVMNNFEFVDPERHVRQERRGRRSLARDAADAIVRRAVAADPGPAAAPRPAFGRHGRLPGRARRRRPARTRVDARPRRRPVGQGRLRRHGDREGGPARPRHDGRAAGRDRAGEHARQHPNSQRPTPKFDLAHLPPDDPAVYDMLTKADTIGVFQVESRAQMATLPRLKPKHFYDLVVQVAIIRPGPIVGDMVHPYLNRRAGREPVIPLHPSLEPVLARTLGVPLFQEQLLRMAMVAAGFTGGQAEELRRAMGFKRSEKRMKQIEVQLREGMAKNGITGDTAERIVNSITSFALYGFPESHAASFALLAYASAYLKVHYPAAFYTALLNNQPMGFYHPASLVKDAQRRGVRFHPIDVQQSDWLCRVETDGAIRLGFMYVNGLRKEMGQAMAIPLQPAGAGSPKRRSSEGGRPVCPKCGDDDESMIEIVREGTHFCNTCAHEWTVPLKPAGRFASIEDLVRRTGLRRDELTTLADIGALNAFTNERRSALWQVERAVRPAGELFENDERHERFERDERSERSPLTPMDEHDRLRADYGGMGLTIGPHPMALRRDEMALRGVLRASDLPQARDGRRVRVAGMVITRQRPGTAKGFVFLTLEDETGVSNIIVRPDLFDRERMTVIRQPFLLVEGVLQHQDGVLSVRAERLQGIEGSASVDAHDFY